MQLLFFAEQFLRATFNPLNSHNVHKLSLSSSAGEHLWGGAKQIIDPPFKLVSVSLVCHFLSGKCFGDALPVVMSVKGPWKQIL